MADARAIQIAPSRRTSLIGRDAEVDAVVELLLHREGVRLVTLAGAGGVGKSVVADEVVRRIAALDPIIVQRLVVPDASNFIGVESVIAVLTGREADLGPARPHAVGRARLVVLDGVGGAPDVVRTIGVALDEDPDLIVLATSITPLLLRGEHVVLLETFQGPRRGERDAARAAAFPAFRLFHERLMAANSGFELTPDRTETISALCELLDGLPLALELAAAHCATMPLEVVAELLQRDSVLALLQVHTNDHANLRDTIRWSYELLEPSQRHVFLGLSAFIGPFVIDALAAVTAETSEARHNPRPQFYADVYALVAAGLLHVVPPGRTGAPRRFVVPAAIREFAVDVAGGAGALVELRARHADHYCDLARAVGSQCGRFGGLAAAQGLIAEKENLITALDRYVARGDTRAGLAFALALGPVWIGTGTTLAGRGCVEAILEQYAAASTQRDHASDPLVVEAAAVLSDLIAWSRDPDFGAVSTRLSQAIESARRSGRIDLLLLTLHAKTQLLVVQGEHDLARGSADEGLGVATEHACDFWQMRFLHWRAIAANNLGDYAPALEDAIAARELALAAGDEHQLLIITHVLAGIRGAHGDVRAGLPPDDDLVALAERLGDARTEGMVRVGVAIRALFTRNPARASAQLGAALSLARRNNLWFLEELSLFVMVCAGLAAGDVEGAVRLHGMLQPAQAAVRKRLPPGAIASYEASVARAEALLGPHAFERLIAAGRLLRWSDAVLLAESIADGANASDDAPERVERRADAESSASTLTARETEVLKLIAEGLSNKEAAVAMHISPKTVMHHTSNIYRKLGVRGRIEAVEAWRRGAPFDATSRDARAS